MNEIIKTVTTPVYPRYARPLPALEIWPEEKAAEEFLRRLETAPREQRRFPVGSKFTRLVAALLA